MNQFKCIFTLETIPSKNKTKNKKNNIFTFTHFVGKLISRDF